MFDLLNDPFLANPVQDIQTDDSAPPTAAEAPQRPATRRPWTFLSSHGQVLICLARSPDQRLRDIAEQVGITERAVQLIIRDLVTEGYLTCSRVGRRNHYTIHHDQPMRHPLAAKREVRVMLDLMVNDDR